MIWYIAFHVGCGLLAWGFIFGYFQRRFAVVASARYWQHMHMALVGFLMGPLGLLAHWLSCKEWKYGLKWW